MAEIIVKILQVVVALGLINVWVLRAQKKTNYRGGDSTNIVDEFSTYGLPAWFCYFVGFLKLASAAALLVGLWYAEIIFYAASLVTILMLGAVMMHFKVNDPIKKAIPASIMFAMNFVISYSSFISGNY